MTRYPLFAAMLLFLTACSAMQDKDVEAPAAVPDTAFLEGLRQSLPGLYGNYAQYWTSQDTGSSNQQHWRLSVVALQSAPGEAWFSLLQYPASDVGQGRTLLLKFTSQEDQVLLQFAPWQQSTKPWTLDAAQISASSRFLPGCSVRLARRPDVLAGQTNPTTCRMTGDDSNEISLVKDFAFSASKIDIGDRIADPATGVSLRDDSIFRFARMQQYRGWAGIKPADSEAWQLARPVELWSDGGTAQLLDVAGEPLGYSIRLAQVPWRTDQDTILRLDLVDRTTGEIIAYSFADNSASSLGINLGWIQVGLTQILP